jgi:hypothetical protein
MNRITGKTICVVLIYSTDLKPVPICYADILSGVIHLHAEHFQKGIMNELYSQRSSQK